MAGIRSNLPLLIDGYVSMKGGWKHTPYVCSFVTGLDERCPRKFHYRNTFFAAGVLRKDDVRFQRNFNDY